MLSRLRLFLNSDNGAPAKLQRTTIPVNLRYNNGKRALAYERKPKTSQRKTIAPNPQSSSCSKSSALLSLPPSLKKSPSLLLSTTTMLPPIKTKP
ncbi:hypothetical protein Bca4012_077645 [Brassica carinata]|uniref:Uncharacterized protein n=1 Tax=Brassica carinata TaxID=52824 RepID=A0A8X7U4S0_BRACI|nr:hypothetical protein Bca52824_072218 [Brassica carinata]